MSLYKTLLVYTHSGSLFQGVKKDSSKSYMGGWHCDGLESHPEKK